MSDQEFGKLKAELGFLLNRAAELQKKYREQTGVYFTRLHSVDKSYQFEISEKEVA